MNYKKIAYIINAKLSQQLHPKSRVAYEEMACLLADHFEEDEKEEKKSGGVVEGFNREQFLKDCGVKK